MFLLNSKGANRKLVVEEGGLTVAQFNAALPAYKDLLDREKANTDRAREELETYRGEREKFKNDIEELRGNQRRLALLLQEIVRANGIVLDEDQQAEFDATKPNPRHSSYPNFSQRPTS